MKTILLDGADDFDGWRAGAKDALVNGFAPAQIRFASQDETGSLFDGHGGIDAGSAQPVRKPVVPKAFLELARQVICHRDPERFDLLYQTLTNLQSDKTLLRKSTNPLVHRLNRLAKEVRRDRHKMKAFVRFRKTGETANGVEQFVAWFEPSHNIVRLTAPFFVRRFTGMQWSILTPDACAHWDGDDLTFSEGVPKSNAPKDDALEDFWRSYYAAIFNPARLKVAAMQSEMPKKYWKNLPEASLIPSMIASARERENDMVESAPTVPKPKMMAHRHVVHPRSAFPVNEIASLQDLDASLKQCRACPLWQPATQAVPGRGSSAAKLMLVGEQPGDREDLSGEAFVGPAGQLLKDVMGEIGIAENDVYITNAVKHFKYLPRGKRRIHQNPRVGEIDACRSWLQKEISLVQPNVIVALGASAIRGITGQSGAVGKMRGHDHAISRDCIMMVTNHPSALLRMNDEKQRVQARTLFKQDLQRAFEKANADRAEQSLRSVLRSSKK